MGPNLSFLYFADDLVIFSKTEMEQAHLLSSTLNHFCEFSSHKISTRKSTIYFFNGTDEGISTLISYVFGFHPVQNLRTYLGVPLLQERITKSTLSFVMDKVRQKLQNCEARKLTIARKVTLAQSVLLSIPN